ncbi:LexA family transcriptional regulator [Afipia sp. P52-10]|uniref:XRE family transcriptional regulator n=1 Tax=Afipia sp. P52-10 TaxID=1429916 RepID=UPI0009DFF8B9|nr:LexA family transcriptional regulator [Afipia sp. P52-10]
MLIHSSSVIRRSTHQFGDDSQALSTALVLGNNTKLVANPEMKGKYPNGLADILDQRKDLTQSDLAKAAGTSPQQISRLYQGEREMTAFWAERLAPVLKVSPESLVFPGLKRIRVPLLSFVSAGRLAHQEGVKRTDIKKYVLAADLPRGDWIALEVMGDSMNLIAPEGSHIYVNRADDHLVNNAFYVFHTPEGDVTFKRYRAGAKPRLQPYSTNPDHETIHPTGELHVFGRVGRVVHDLL